MSDESMKATTGNRFRIGRSREEYVEGGRLYELEALDQEGAEPVVLESGQVLQVVDCEEGTNA